jgi:hypothetical protein
LEPNVKLVFGCFDLCLTDQSPESGIISFFYSCSLSLQVDAKLLLTTCHCLSILQHLKIVQNSLKVKLAFVLVDASNYIAFDIFGCLCWVNLINFDPADKELLNLLDFWLKFESLHDFLPSTVLFYDLGLKSIY